MKELLDTEIRGCKAIFRVTGRLGSQVVVRSFLPLHLTMQSLFVGGLLRLHQQPKTIADEVRLLCGVLVRNQFWRIRQMKTVVFGAIVDEVRLLCGVLVRVLENDKRLVVTHFRGHVEVLEHFDGALLLTVRFRFLLHVCNGLDQALVLDRSVFDGQLLLLAEKDFLLLASAVGKEFKLRRRSLLRQVLRRLFRADDLFATAVATHFQVILF